MITSKISAAIGFAVGLVLMFGAYATVNTLFLLPKAREQGKQNYIAERAVADLKAEQERKKDDAQLQRDSDYDLCVRALGRVPGCDVFMFPVRKK